MYVTNTQPRGFIALMSAIIISAILLIIAASGSLMSYYSRMNVLDFESKERSSALADACVDEVLLKLANDSNYPTGYTMPDTITVGSDTCQVLGAANPGGNPRTFQIQAIYDHAYTNLAVVVDVNTLAVSSWKEIATY